MKTLSLSLGLLIATIGFAAAEEMKTPDKVRLEQMTARFAPTDLKVDLKNLSANDRKVLAKLV